MDFMEIRSMQKARIDIACGGNKNKGFIGLDKRDLPGVDIVMDLEEFPWRQIPESSCEVAVCSHFMEHLKPWLTIDFMNEVWRILEVGGTFAISVPYAGSRGFWQDPTHVNGLNEVTWQYFDPSFPLYGIYKPKPWKLHEGFPCYQVQGNLEVLLEKMSEEEGEETSIITEGRFGISEASTEAMEAKTDLNVIVSENVDVQERVGG